MDTNILVILGLALAAIALVLLVIVIILVWQILRRPRPGSATIQNPSPPAAAPNPIPAIPQEPVAKPNAGQVADPLPPGPLLLQPAIIHCPRCGVDQPSSAAFCGQCGQPLSIKPARQNPAGHI